MTFGQRSIDGLVGTYDDDPVADLLDNLARFFRRIAELFANHPIGIVCFSQHSLELYTETLGLTRQKNEQE